MKLFLFFLAVTTVLCDNFTTIALSYENCILFIQYYNSTSFNMITCYKVLDSIESTTSWSNCTQSCCDPNKVYEQVNSTLENCDQDRKDYYKSKEKDSSSSSSSFDSIIYWFTMTGLFGLVILIFLICCIRDCWASRQAANQSRLARVPQVPIAPSVPVQRIESGVSPNPFWPYANIRWTKQRKRQEVCPICLLGDARIELACKHMVHWECWKEWSTRKNQCALCRSDDVRELKIYCYSCKGAYFMCRNGDLQRLSTCPQIVCDECKGPNNIS